MRPLFLCIVKSHKLAKKQGKISVYNGGIRLNAKNVQIQESKNTQDIWLYIQPLRLYLPIQLYDNKWDNLGLLTKDVCFNKDYKGDWYAKLSYEIPAAETDPRGSAISIDVGITALITTPFREYGTRLNGGYDKKLREIRRLKANPIKGKKLKNQERKLSEFVKNVHNRELNSFIADNKPSVVVVEKLDIRGTGGKRSRKFNEKISRIGISGLKSKLKIKAEEFGFKVIEVNPAYTSQTCPICGHIERGNRIGKKFCCCGCGFTADADFVGSVNIFRRSGNLMTDLIKKNKVAVRIPPEQLDERGLVHWLSSEFELQGNISKY